MTFLIGGANTLDDAYSISNSLRFDGSSSEMEDTLGTPTNIKKFTISLWFKRSALYADITTGQSLISCYRGAVGNPFGAFNFGGNDHIEFLAFDDENTTVMNIQTNFRFRDPSAWYHVVVAVDTTQGTASNRVKFYINGTQQTSFSTASYPAENKELAWNQSSTVHYIGHYQYTNATWMNGYEAEFAFIDGSALAPTSFGETNGNGVWVPIDFKDDVTFGDNGYYLEFKQTGTSQNASGIGADTSGNDRHFAVSGLAATDVTVDTPTNNFCTLNSLANSSYTTLSEGALKTTGNSATNNGNTEATMAVANGKWYWEHKMTTGADPYYPTTGALKPETVGRLLNGGTNAMVGVVTDSVGYEFDGDRRISNTSTDDHFSSLSDGDILGIALDMDNGAVYFSKAGTWENSSDPESGASKTNAAHTWTADGRYMMPATASYNGSVAEINFGNPSYANSSSVADANGYGAFEYAVPSGFYALCTKNLAKYG